MVWKLFLIVLILIGLAVIGLGISIFFTKKKKFPETHIGRSKAMNERGISCAATTDRNERATYKPIDVEKIAKDKNA